MAEEVWPRQTHPYRVSSPPPPPWFSIGACIPPIRADEGSFFNLHFRTKEIFSREIHTHTHQYGRLGPSKNPRRDFFSPPWTKTTKPPDPRGINILKIHPTSSTIVNCWVRNWNGNDDLGQSGYQRDDRPTSSFLHLSEREKQIGPTDETKAPF